MRIPTLIAKLALLACIPAQAIESCPLPAGKVKTENQAVERVFKAVEAYRIGKLKPECMALVANKQKSGFLVDVRERHNEACGGDPMTEPRAYSVDVAWNGNMKSDVYDHVSYQPLICPKT